MRHPIHSLHKKIFEHIQECGDLGAMCDEISEDLDILLSTVSSRVTQLVARGYIYKTNKRRVTRRGVTARVYREKEDE